MKSVPLFVILLCAASAWAQTTKPAAPASAPDDMLKKLLLGPPRNAPIQPEPDEPRIDHTSKTAIAPKAPTQNLIREGTILLEKIGRLTRAADGQAEFTFEIDGQAMKDPPMIILPSLQLMVMETAVKNSSAAPKFRIVGKVTEYGNRNYLLVEKAVVVSAAVIPPQPPKGSKDHD